MWKPSFLRPNATVFLDICRLTCKGGQSGSPRGESQDQCIEIGCLWIHGRGNLFHEAEWNGIAVYLFWMWRSVEVGSPELMMAPWNHQGQGHRELALFLVLLPWIHTKALALGFWRPFTGNRFIKFIGAVTPQGSRLWEIYFLLINLTSSSVFLIYFF